MIDTDAPAPVRRHSRTRRVVQFLRRGHLYAGLLMLPWVLLYGVTAFLFNHPEAFPDQPTATFGKDALVGTPLENLPPPAEVAGKVVAALQARAKDGERYTLVEPGQARYTREFAFATVRADGQEVSVLLNADGTGGTVRSRPLPPPRPEEKAPFAVTGRTPPKLPAKTSTTAAPRPGTGLTIPDPLHERVKVAVPTVLERTGFPQGDVTVTSVPDLSFLMDADGTVWRVAYNAQTGTVTGRVAADEPAAEPISARRFLLRLHTAHGYPGEPNARWVWAVVVDVMAGVMVFWGVSGLLMWWQVKSTRWVGLVILLLSAVAATWVGIGMYEVMAAR